MFWVWLILALLAIGIVFALIKFLFAIWFVIVPILLVIAGIFITARFNLFTSKSRGKFIALWAIVSAISITLFTFGIYNSSTATTKSKPEQTASSSKIKISEIKSSSISESTEEESASSSGKDESQLKLGMTKEEIVNLLGEPDSKSDFSWSYGGKDIYFNDYEHLSGGNMGNLVDQVLASGRKSRASASNETNTQKAFAQSFGQKAVDRLQKMPTVYKSTQLDATTMEYMWNSEHGIMIRLDTADRMTNVYLYDSNADYGRGRLLYSGRTIFTSPKVYNFYN